MMDEAFMPLREMIQGLMAFGGDLTDDESGVHSYIERCEVESPIELDVFRDETGAVRIGSAPPLYYVDTTYRPSFHRIRFTAELTRKPDGD